ncbi:MAG TPA: LPS export ABC transporter periplasmic protein LptC [Terriglobales bacterium]|nr:LPS export ABC transporter periplasmic protein LptC [Terriglobales bacterium]
MAFNPKKLRIAIAGLGILLFAIVLGFYSYAKYKIASQIKEIPRKLGADIQRTAQGFTYTQSSGGKALFTISAGNAVQYKDGQRAQLENVRIIVYGEGDEYDQIFGKAFAYDPRSGEVTAQGEVLIDLQAEGKPGPDPLKNSEQGRVHFRTSGLTFNQKTGIAQTREKIDFSIPQASGSARGAIYDSRQRSLTLSADVRLATSGQPSHSKLDPTTVLAGKAVIEDQPLRAVLSSVRMEQPTRNLNAREVTILLNDDNTIAKIAASGDVTAEATGKTSSSMRAQHADFDFAAGNLLKKAVLNGAVTVHATGASPIDGSAGRAVIDFTGRNDVAQVRASESVRFEQKGADQQATAVQADTVDFFFAGKSQLQRAVTSGASQIVLRAAGSNQRSVITAGGFTATFSGKNRMQALTGTPNARIVTTAPGLPDRVITANRMVANFDPRSAGRTSINDIDVQGSVDYREGQRRATAESGRFNASDDTLNLTGSPRIEDGEAGFIVSGKTLRLNRKTGELSGQGQVKTTYRQLKAAAGGGAMLSGNDPIHATAEAVTANRNTGVARFTGTARLWQGANMVQAPTIVFEKDERALTATGNAEARVQTVFVQVDKAGKQLPVQVSAQRLSYIDVERKGHFEGKVKVKVPETNLTAGRVDILLKPKAAGAVTGAASQVDQIIATGGEGANVLIEQENPVRRAVGERLVYSAAESKFVLTGAAGNPPSIFDAERGNLTGDSLTFYTRDDRVHVGSGDSSRTITRTRVKDESKP